MLLSIHTSLLVPQAENDALQVAAQEEVLLLWQQAFATRMMPLYLTCIFVSDVGVFAELLELIQEVQSVCLPRIVASSV